MKVLYISTSFTALTHTFITREVAQLRRQDLTVELLAVRIPRTGAAAITPECDVSKARQIYPVSPLRVLGCTLLLAMRRPYRMANALRHALSSTQDSVGAKLKLMAQACVATTQVRWVESLDIDHIHAHFATSPATFAMFLHIFTGKPFSFTGHAVDVFRDRIALDTKLRLASGTVAISRHNQQYYESIITAPHNVKVIHCGLDIRSQQFHHRTGAHSPLRIVSVGRCVPKKGFVFLLQALALLNDRRIPWEAELIGDGPELPALNSVAAELGLNSLHFLGMLQQSDIQKRLRSAGVFVLPCITAPDGDVDGIPVSLMEAMAMGCPVISTRISGIPELVEDGKSGLLVMPEDATALASSLERIANQEGLASTLSRGGREKVERDFNILVTGPQLALFFEDCSHRAAQRMTSPGPD